MALLPSTFPLTWSRYELTSLGDGVSMEELNRTMLELFKLGCRFFHSPMLVVEETGEVSIGLQFLCPSTLATSMTDAGGLRVRTYENGERKYYEFEELSASGVGEIAEEEFEIIRRNVAKDETEHYGLAAKISKWYWIVIEWGNEINSGLHDFQIEVLHLAMVLKEYGHPGRSFSVEDILLLSELSSKVDQQDPEIQAKLAQLLNKMSVFETEHTLLAIRTRN